MCKGSKHRLHVLLMFLFLELKVFASTFKINLDLTFFGAVLESADGKSQGNLGIWSEWRLQNFIWIEYNGTNPVDIATWTIQQGAGAGTGARNWKREIKLRFDEAFESENYSLFWELFGWESITREFVGAGVPWKIKKSLELALDKKFSSAGIDFERQNIEAAKMPCNQMEKLYIFGIWNIFKWDLSYEKYCSIPPQLHPFSYQNLHYKPTNSAFLSGK